MRTATYNGLMRKLPLLLLLVLLLTLGAAPKKKSPPPVPVAPADIAHPMALFLKQLSKDGTRQVTFRATAVGTRFFFEETTGVTVYRFQGGKYVREAFLRGVRLPAAVKRYAKP
jgi:hypothetical protein